MAPVTLEKSCCEPARRRGIDVVIRRRRRDGFSSIELLIVAAILISLAALGGVAYQSYLASVKETLSKQQSSRITEQVETNVGLVIRGANARLRSQVTGYPITEMCQRVHGRAEGTASGPQEPL